MESGEYFLNEPWQYRVRSASLYWPQSNLPSSLVHAPRAAEAIHPRKRRSNSVRELPSAR